MTLQTTPTTIRPPEGAPIAGKLLRILASVKATALDLRGLDDEAASLFEVHPLSASVGATGGGGSGCELTPKK